MSAAEDALRRLVDAFRTGEGLEQFEALEHAEAVLQRINSAEERVVDDVPSPVPKAPLSCRPMWESVTGSD